MKTNSILCITLAIILIILIWKYIPKKTINRKINFYAIIPRNTPEFWYVMAGKTSFNQNKFIGLDNIKLNRKDFEFIPVAYDEKYEDDFDSLSELLKYCCTIYQRLYQPITPKEEEK